MNNKLKLCIGWFALMGRWLLSVGQNVRTLLGPASGWNGLKRWLLQFATILVGISSIGFLVVVLGLVPIKASSGHWPITAWILNFTMSRSVSTHAMGIQVPALHDPGMVLKGATLYETGCFPCHGNPTIQRPRIAMQMTPHPPYLPPVIHEWKPSELFYIVKHGVKFTGMPAWPAQQRDDEVWAIVAFLQKFPQLDEQEYRQMVNGEYNESGEVVSIQALSGRNLLPRSIRDTCVRCHGPEGQGRQGGVAPKLAGQKSAYIETALETYKLGKRHSGVMEPIAAALSREEIRDLSRYFSELEAIPTVDKAPEFELAINRGATIAQQGLPKARIPICAECHGPSNDPRNKVYPTLVGQYADSITMQLRLFADDRRGGSEFATLMHPIADLLSTEQMRDVALYYESLAVPPIREQ